MHNVPLLISKIFKDISNGKTDLETQIKKYDLSVKEQIEIIKLGEYYDQKARL